jgi:ApbE superfamily uncharacterized protein (UPF0280 family)
MQGAAASLLPDGRRLHLHHGPIDLIVDVTGGDREAGFRRATERFSTVLDELVSELAGLRRPTSDALSFDGPVARRMQRAVAPFQDEFITPMAAVAGAVADEILSFLTGDAGCRKAYVNNGGDTAFFLAAGQSIHAAIANDLPAGLTIRASDPWRGVATSGWRGRSHSLGIADSVTVVAENAAAADAAATMIANRVDLPGHMEIERTPASELAPDSDLGDRPVTTGVGTLTDAETAEALDSGRAYAEGLVRRGVIGAALLFLNRHSRQTGANFKSILPDRERTHA